MLSGYALVEGYRVAEVFFRALALSVVAPTQGSRAISRGDLHVGRE
jgi:hypothetical protein